MLEAATICHKYLHILGSMGIVLSATHSACIYVANAKYNHKKVIDFIDNQSDFHSIVIKPNRAMSWRGLVISYVGISIVSLGIAISFYSAGYPLILPFSGAELLLLGYALYITAWRGNWQEVVTITEEKVRIEKGHNKLEDSYEFQRPWAKIVLEKSWNSWYPARLMIRSHGKQLEIGAFLNEQERQGLAELLEKTLSQTAET